MFADVVMFDAKSRRFGKSDEARRCLTKLREAGWTVTKYGEVLTAQRSPTMFAEVAMSQGSMADVPKFV
jgi:hypothetical protein